MWISPRWPGRPLAGRKAGCSPPPSTRRPLPTHSNGRQGGTTPQRTFRLTLHEAQAHACTIHSALASYLRICLRFAAWGRNERSKGRIMRRWHIAHIAATWPPLSNGACNQARAARSGLQVDTAASCRRPREVRHSCAGIPATTAVGARAAASVASRRMPTSGLAGAADQASCAEALHAETTKTIRFHGDVAEVGWNCVSSCGEETSPATVSTLHMMAWPPRWRRSLWPDERMVSHFSSAMYAKKACRLLSSKFEQSS